MSRTTRPSQGTLCLSVYELVCGTFAMSAVVPAVWLWWTRFALQPPFALRLRLFLLLYLARLCLDSGGMGSDRASVVVRCSMLPDGPLQEKDSIGINTAGFLYLAVVVSFWIIARVDRCRTDSAHAMPPAWPGWAHLAERYSRCRGRGCLEM